MHPDDLADELRAELVAAFEDLGLEPTRFEIAVDAPPEPIGGHHVAVRVVRDDGRRLDCELSAPLAVAYLADEEAAVNEWKEWLEEVRVVFG